MFHAKLRDEWKINQIWITKFYIIIFGVPYSRILSIAGAIESGGMSLNEADWLGGSSTFWDRALPVGLPKPVGTNEA